VLENVLRLTQAIVDVISSNGWLKLALFAMKLSQMIVQAMWIGDSLLSQLPHFSKEIINRCTLAQITDIESLMNMEDEDRSALL